MAVNVTLGSSGTRIVTQSPSTTARLKTAVTNTSKTQTSTSIDGLQGVDLQNLADGDTLVYDSDSGNWESAPLSSANVSVNSIDGGTF
jgi:hypothetical protein